LTNTLSYSSYQGDQKIGGKIAQVLKKVAQTVAKLKNAKMSSSKFNLKIQKHLYQTTSEFLK
jgi:hypothetical protein